MAKIIETRTIDTIGTGRPDYSQDIQLSTIPIIRSYQEPAYYIKEFSIPANNQATDHAEFEYAHFIFNGGFSVSANVLVELRVDSEGLRIIYGMGYQSILVEITPSFPVDEIDITVLNHSNIDVTGWYWHHGVKGLEKIEPEYYPVP